MGSLKELLKVVSLYPKLALTRKNTAETRPTGKIGHMVMLYRVVFRVPIYFHFDKGSRGLSEGEVEVEFPRRGNVLLRLLS